jgi:DNA polymerase I-like protein with 3'-5' exonuclease and polymerase domains
MVAMAQHDAFAELTMLAQVHDELVWEAWDSLVTPGLLEDLQLAGETWHGFDLRVPLVFEPHAGPTWAAAKGGDLDIIELLEEETWDE